MILLKCQICTRNSGAGLEERSSGKFFWVCLVCKLDSPVPGSIRRRLQFDKDKEDGNDPG